jgi:hypothetical protein
MCRHVLQKGLQTGAFGQNVVGGKHQTHFVVTTLSKDELRPWQNVCPVDQHNC